jgi:hypothetical protein
LFDIVPLFPLKTVHVVHENKINSLTISNKELSSSEYSIQARLSSFQKNG